MDHESEHLLYFGYWILQGESVKDTCSFPCCPATSNALTVVATSFINISAPHRHVKCLSETSGSFVFPYVMLEA